MGKSISKVIEQWHKGEISYIQYMGRVAMIIRRSK